MQKMIYYIDSYNAIVEQKILWLPYCDYSFK